MKKTRGPQKKEDFAKTQRPKLRMFDLFPAKSLRRKGTNGTKSHKGTKTQRNKEELTQRR
jgi:hypothetical protein